MPLTLTQVYLETAQKKALAAQARKSGRKSSDLMREAVDALLLGVNAQELKELDVATRRAADDIDAMLVLLDRNAREHAAFMREMRRLRGSAEIGPAAPPPRAAAAKSARARRTA
jgi:hypothetical protein